MERGEESKKKEVSKLKEVQKEKKKLVYWYLRMKSFFFCSIFFSHWIAIILSMAKEDYNLNRMDDGLSLSIILNWNTIVNF